MGVVTSTFVRNRSKHLTSVIVRVHVALRRFVERQVHLAQFGLLVLGVDEVLLRRLKIFLGRTYSMMSPPKSRLSRARVIMFYRSGMSHRHKSSTTEELTPQ